MKFTDVAAAIRDMIAKRNLRPGAILPSSQSLAKQYGCHRRTMDRACLVLICEGLLCRKGYKFAVGAGLPHRAPVEGDIYVLSYWDGFNRAAERILTALGVKHHLVDLVHHRHPSPLAVLRKVLSQKPAGMILWMPSWADSLQPVLKEATIPTVICTDAAPPDLRQSTVGMDIYRGTEKALRYLVSLGHRQIAFATLNPSPATDPEMTACYRSVCRQIGLRRSASAIWRLEPGNEEASCDILLKQRRQHPEVTALFAEAYAAALAVKVFRVPSDLSVVSFYEPMTKCSPPLTMVVLRDLERIPSWACSEIIAQLHALESGLPPKPPQQVLFVPDLVVQGSTALNAKHRASKGKLPNNIELSPSHLPPPLASSATGAELESGSSKPHNSPWESRCKTYPYLKKKRVQNWRQIDLSDIANHSMTREHGWLGGAPLLHFPHGLHAIHGIPFRVIDEKINGGRAVVTFRSPKSHSTDGQELPVQVKLPVGGSVKALYFLHGCGWALPVLFAEYIVHFKTGQVERIPLIPIGPSMHGTRQHPAGLKPNLQDWWPDLKQKDFPHAKYVTVFNPADPQEYERYLYTLEWINPRPEEEVSHIEARIDPEAGPSLALIAVTALVADDRITGWSPLSEAPQM